MWIRKTWRKLLRRAIIWAAIKNIQKYGYTLHEPLDSPRTPSEIKREMIEELMKHLVREGAIVIDEHQSQTSLTKVYRARIMALKW